MISFIMNLQKRIATFHKEERIPYEIKNYYIVTSCTIPILIFVGLVFLLGKSELVLSVFCFASAIYVFFSTLIASKTKQQKRFAFILTILLNFFIIPTMFLLSEGILFGMVLFFILGIILTIVLLGREKNFFILVVLEGLFDIALVIYTYFYSEKVYIGTSKLTQAQAMSFAFLLVSVTIIFIFNYQNYFHGIVRLNIERDNIAITKAENTKGRFLANMTHEIRTPMNAIIGMTELLLRENLSKNSREYVDTIKTSSAQLLQIINNILEFSKLDSGRADAVNYEYSFKELIKEIITNVSNDYMKDGAYLHVFLSKDINDRMFGDDVRIKQVLRYLLFSPLSKNKNGIVNLSVDSDYDYETCQAKLKFRIASTGRGLTEEEIAAIYNAYSNYDSRQKTDYNRTGLEISICQKILNMMDGELKIESIEGIGNAIEFSFFNYVVDETPIVCTDDISNKSILIYIKDRLKELIWQRLVEECEISATYVYTPFAFKRALEGRNFDSIYMVQDAYSELKEYIDVFGCEDKVFVVATRGQGAGAFGNCKILRHPVYLFNFLETLNGTYDESQYHNSNEKIVIKYPQARVLCVDDSIVNLKVFNTLLKSYDIKPTNCSSGKEALELLEDSEFDILFIDHKMPEMDGAQLVSNIRNMSGNNALVPIICATADFGPSVKEGLEKEGFDDYIAKPINVIYLEELLETYIPKELHVETRIVLKTEDKKPDTSKKEPAIDPLVFEPSVGIENLGGSKEAYLSVLLTYFKEGVQMIVDVPRQFADGDISLYTTNVHALKSSSATVGCIGISPLFKELEFAGKKDDKEFIANNSDKAFDYFVKVLDKVREYLLGEGIKLDEDEEEADDREVVDLDTDLLTELSGCILTMNLRRVEEIIDILLSNNYGSEINTKIRMIKDSYDGFEYMEIKKIVEEII